MSRIDNVIPGEDGVGICMPVAVVGPGKTSPFGDVAKLREVKANPGVFDWKRWASVDVNIFIELGDNVVPLNGVV
jgi:hypothetical protein